MTKAKEPYQRLEAKAARGIYSLVDPFDYLLLAILPEEGTLMGGFYPIGETMTSLRRRFPGLSSGTLSSHLMSLKRQGLTIMAGGEDVSKKSVKALGWQRTEKGKQIFDEWPGKEKHSEWLQAQKSQQT